MDVALATCRHLPEPDPDADLLRERLGALGVDARWLAWDDPTAPFDAARLVVIRSTWNYPDHRDAFLAWVDALPVPLLNPPAIVRRNLHKSYLLDLAAAGVPIIPTVIASTPDAVIAAIETHGWTDVVVKPVVGAASRGTARFHRAADAAAHAHALAVDVLVQPWQGAVLTRGERDVVVIDGVITHAIRKAPRLAGQHERASTEAMPVAPAEAALAHAALATLPSPLLYARVDMVADDDGAPRILELELVEPSLFLAQHPPAADRLARAIAARLTATGG